VDEALQNIVGVDVHPLAVTISKVNYVLALAPDLSSYGKTVVLPVYMADSLQAVEPTGGELVTIRADGEQFFNIPRYMATDPASLDEVIDAMRKYVSGPEDIALDGFSAYLESQGYKDTAYLWRPNLRLMRKLVAEGRDTIWAFILKNYYRPAYLRQHPFDIVAGNPPRITTHNFHIYDCIIVPLAVNKQLGTERVERNARLCRVNGSNYRLRPIFDQFYSLLGWHVRINRRKPQKYDMLSADGH
jgi:hypothetical protein